MMKGIFSKKTGGLLPLCRPVKLMLLMLAATGWLTTGAQPSGGPYGPIHQSWPVPKTS